jgi:DNA invertase Pin-like site-specific DNA recombinase
MTTTAGIYVRISEDREGAGLGVKRQEVDCRDLAAKLGWEVREVYVDNDLSAYTGKERPAYLQLLEDVRSGQLGGLLTWHTDRLTRSPRELEDIISACESGGGVPIQTVTAGPIDLATPSGRMAARVFGAVARHESEHKAERIRRKARELAESGKIGGGGTRPYGYESDRRTVIADEAAVVRDLARRTLAGEPLRALVRDLNTRKVPSVSGRGWTTVGLRRMLTSGRIAGWREHHRQLVAPAEWQGIIDRATLDRLRGLLLDPARRLTPGPVVRVYLFGGGIARCGLCGYPLHAAPRSDGTRRYGCRPVPGAEGCAKIAIVAEPLEAHLRDLIIERLDSPAFLAALADHDRRTAQAVDLDALAADEASLLELATDYYTDHRIGRAEYLAARDALQARIETARRKVARTNGSGKARELAGLGGRLREEWDAMTFDERRTVVSTLVDKVAIGPGRRGYNRFEPSRVTITWRY